MISLFAKYNDTHSYLSKKECFKVIKSLKDHGTEKINLAGGEPTLSPFLGELISFSKRLGLTLSILSNGIGITKSFLNKYKSYIDWIGLSLDSGNESIQYQLGRGNGTYVRDIITKSKLIKSMGIKLKINSVITKLNYQENMTLLIQKLNPDRWKVFRALQIYNKNCDAIQDLLISQDEFELFVKRHEKLNPISEYNNDMIDSYVMIDPQGRFYQNSKSVYIFSAPILKVGVRNALNEVQYNYDKFLERGGLYNW